jgi:hypothetical protein
MLTSKMPFTFNEAWTIQTFIDEVLEKFTAQEDDDAGTTIVMAALINAGRTVNDSSCCNAKWPVCRQLPGRFFGVGDMLFWKARQDLLGDLNICRELAKNGDRACLLVNPERVTGLRGVIEIEEVWNVLVHDPATFISSIIEFNSDFSSSSHASLIRQLFQTFDLLTERGLTSLIECKSLYGRY